MFKHHYPLHTTLMTLLYKFSAKSQVRDTGTSQYIPKRRQLFPMPTILWVLAICITCIRHLAPNNAQNTKRPHTSAATCSTWLS